MRPRPVPDNLSAEDQSSYRKWTGRLFAFYVAAVVLAIGVTYLTSPAADPAMTQMARLKPATGSNPVPRATPIVRQQSPGDTQSQH